MAKRPPRTTRDNRRVRATNGREVRSRVTTSKGKRGATYIHETKPSIGKRGGLYREEIVRSAKTNRKVRTSRVHIGAAEK